jgi:pimeloyl-ACP methyl ester carboxylesterase
MANSLQLREPDEASELVRLSFDELAGAFGGIHSFHGGIAARVFRWTGPASQPVRVVHDRVAETVYGGLAAATRGLGGAAANAVDRRPRWSGRVVSTTPQGAALIAALDGLIGDALEKRRSSLQEPMSVRAHGRPVPIERTELARAFPAPTPRIVVFLHGLMETEYSWRLGARETGETYGTRLERDLGVTPVYVRYNSGRHISHNGCSLAELIEQLVAEWPVKVSEIALVGHSMGGLVARSACFQASEDDMKWTRLVRRVVSVGTPHMGAPLEQFVHWASAGLSLLPETRPFSRFLRRRSAGIRDLRQGSLVDEDWSGRDPDDLRAAVCREIPLLDGATHCFVTATVTRSPRHPVGRLVGDYLVLQPSGSGRSRTRRIGFDETYGLHVGGANHFALLNHPAVYEKLREWLSPTPRRRRRQPAAA